MTVPSPQKELDLFQRIASGLSEFDQETQERILQMVITFLKLNGNGNLRAASSSTQGLKEGSPSPVHSFRAAEEISPKEFIIEKAPNTDIERVVCLAFYLHHYRDIPHFVTLDISKLNTEAAQPKFTNAAQAVKNATNKGLIVPVSRGKKQLSAIGEQFVDALPERQAAREVLHRTRKRRNKRGTNKNKET